MTQLHVGVHGLVEGRSGAGAETALILSQRGCASLLRVRIAEAWAGRRRPDQSFDVTFTRGQRRARAGSGASSKATRGPLEEAEANRRGDEPADGAFARMPPPPGRRLSRRRLPRFPVSRAARRHYRRRGRGEKPEPRCGRSKQASGPVPLGTSGGGGACPVCFSSGENRAVKATTKCARLLAKCVAPRSPSPARGAELPALSRRRDPGGHHNGATHRVRRNEEGARRASERGSVSEIFVKFRKYLHWFCNVQ